MARAVLVVGHGQAVGERRAVGGGRAAAAAGAGGGNAGAPAGAEPGGAGGGRLRAEDRHPLVVERGQKSVRDSNGVRNPSCSGRFGDRSPFCSVSFVPPFAAAATWSSRTCCCPTNSPS